MKLIRINPNFIADNYEDMEKNVKDAQKVAKLLAHAAQYYLPAPRGQTPGEAQSRRRFLLEIDEALKPFLNSPLRSSS